jgi:hypothetical protein
MALSFGDYGSSDSDSRLRDKLRLAFDYAFDKNGEFEQSEGVKTVAEWYKVEKEYKQEKQEDGDNKRTVLSLLTNKITTELVKLVEPRYKASIIDSVGLDTHFKTGVTQLNLNVQFISLKPFVKFVKQVNRKEVASAKFRFQLDTNMYINKLQIHASSAAGGKSIDIHALGIEFKLSLLQVNISSMRMPVPVISLNQPIKLISRKFEINNLSFPIEKQ